MEVPHYRTADQVHRLLDELADQNHHQACIAALITWRTGLRVAEFLEFEWRDLDYQGTPATIIVRQSKTQRARTVRMCRDLVQSWHSGHKSHSRSVRALSRGRRTILPASGN